MHFSRRTFSKNDSVGSEHVEERQQRGRSERFEANTRALKLIGRRFGTPNDLSGQHERIPKNGRDDLDLDGKVLGPVDLRGEIFRGCRRRLFGELDTRTTEAHVANDHGEGVFVPRSQEGVDANGHAAVSAEMVPRRHESGYYGVIRGERSDIVALGEPLWSAAKDGRKIDAQPSWVFCRLQGNIRPAARFRARLRGDNSPFEMGVDPDG